MATSALGSPEGAAAAMLRPVSTARTMARLDSRTKRRMIGWPGAGGGLPVDVLDVVAGAVLHLVVEVLAVPGEDRAVPPVEQPGGAAHRGQVEAGPHLREPGGGVLGVHGRQGAGTAWNTASMMASGATLLARAS